MLVFNQYVIKIKTNNKAFICLNIIKNVFIIKYLLLFKFFLL